MDLELFFRLMGQLTAMDTPIVFKGATVLSIRPNPFSTDELRQVYQRLALPPIKPEYAAVYTRVCWFLCPFYSQSAAHTAHWCAEEARWR